MILYIRNWIIFTAIMVMTIAAGSAIHAQNTTGRLIIIGYPDSTIVSANDMIIGHDMSGWYQLSSGNNLIQIHKGDSLLFSRNMEIVPGQDYRIIFECLIDCALLEIASKPDKAVFALDGEVQGNTPFLSSYIKPGERVLTLELPGYAVLIDTITMATGQRQKLDLTLERSQAYKDSVKQVQLRKKRSRQLVYKLTFSALSLAAAGVGAYFDRSAATSMKRANESAISYDGARENFSDYRDSYNEQRNDALNAVRKRNIFYGAAGMSLLVVSVSFFF